MSTSKSRRRGKNEGSITQRKDGRWFARLHLRYGPNGQRIRKSFYAATREDVAKLLTDAKAKHDKGIPIPVGRRTVGEFLKSWLEDVKRTAEAPRTYESYEYVVRIHLLEAAPTFKCSSCTARSDAKFKTCSGCGLAGTCEKEPGKPSAFSKIPLAKLRPEHIRRLLTQKFDENKLSNRTIAYIRVVLKIALQQAVGDRTLEYNPADSVKAPKRDKDPRKRVRRVLSEDEAQKFLAAVAGDRLEALYTVALAVGLRKGEALGLRWSDIDLDGRTMWTTQQVQRLSKKISAEHGLIARKQKSESSRRSFELPDTLVRALRSHKARQAQERLLAGTKWRDSGLVFTNHSGGPIDPRTLHDWYKALLVRAGLPSSITFHGLRHSAAELLLDQPGVELKDIQDLLGHSQISLTADLYAKVARSRKKSLADKMDAMLTKTSR